LRRFTVPAGIRRLLPLGAGPRSLAGQRRWRKEQYMSEQQLFWLAVTAMAFGMVITGGILFFCWKAFCKRQNDAVKTFCFSEKNGKLEIKDAGSIIPNIREEKELNLDFMENRNQFWFGVGQIVVITASIVLITVLLLLGKIEPDAGMPVLSGLAGFAIAKGSSGMRTVREK
jgi:hypothetical protein